MANLLDTCQECFQYELPACPDSIYIISESFEMGEDIFLEIEDKFGIKYFLDNVSQGQTYGGSLFLNLDALPEGLFTEHSGAFIFRFYTDIDCNELKEMIFCDKVYECISVTFVKYVGEKEAVICCEPAAGYG